MIRLVRSRHKLSVDGSIVMDSEITMKKKFIVRLLTALHAAGNLTFRTERLVRRVAGMIGVHITCTILPKRVILSFQEELALDPAKSEAYTFPLIESWNIYKLSLLETLCADISATETSIDIFLADERLESIELLQDLYPKPFMAAIYFVCSFSCAMLFYGATPEESAWAGVLGLLVYGMLALCDRLHGLSEIISFACAFVVAALATVLDSYVYNGRLCLFGTMYGGVIWLFPGLSITMSLLEIYSGMVVYGSSKLVYGVSQASQLGFGLALGRIFASDNDAIPDSFLHGCKYPVNDAWGFLLLPVCASCISIMINAKYTQLPGMVFSSSVGMLTAYWLARRNYNPSVNAFICAILVTAASRIYALIHGNERPLVYIISGLIILVPGGVGVRGTFTSTLSGDANSGLTFTFSLIMISIILAIGVFVALIPSQSWLFAKPLRVDSLDVEQGISVNGGNSSRYVSSHGDNQIGISGHGDSVVSENDTGSYEGVRNPMIVEQRSFSAHSANRGVEKSHFISELKSDVHLYK